MINSSAFSDGKFKNVNSQKTQISSILFHSIEKIIYGIVVMAVSSYSLDMILEGSKQSAQVMIFSEKYKEIAKKQKIINAYCCIVQQLQ